MVAANHALSDCHAMCAEAVSALAVVIVPLAAEEKMEDSLFQVTNQPASQPANQPTSQPASQPTNPRNR
jgi:hypothetical protein